MAINRISGNILQDNLQRGANLAIQGNLIYFDVSNDRVGILTSSPQEDFDVDGNLRVGNVTIFDAGNIDAGNVWINNLQDPVANSDAATKYYVDNIGSNVNITISDGANTQQVFNGSTITFLAVANQTAISVTATDNVTVGLADSIAINQDLTVQGNISANNLSVNLAIDSDSVTVQGNISGNNLTISSVTETGNLVVLNDATIQGNLDVTDIVANSVTANLLSSVMITASGNIVYDGAVIGNLILGNLGLVIQSQGDQDIQLDPGMGLVEISTTTGLVIPVGDTTERPGNAVTGTVRYNTDTERVEIYDGTEWDQVLSDVSAQIITPDGSTAAYTLDRDSTDPATLVAINGVIQLPGVAYSVTGNIITFAEPPLTTDIIDIRFL